MYFATVLVKMLLNSVTSTMHWQVWTADVDELLVGLFNQHGPT